MHHYTRISDRELPDWFFAGWLWCQLTIVFLLATIVAEQIRQLPNFWNLVGVLVSLPILFIAWRIAKSNDGALTSFAAVIIGSIAYGMLAGGYTNLARTPDLVRVFTVFGYYAALSGMFEAATPGLWARLWLDNNSRPDEIFAGVICLIPAAMAVIIYAIFAAEQVPTSVGLVEVLVGFFMLASTIREYGMAWAGKHTLDNAIDFSSEFIFGFWELLPRWRKTHELE